MEQNNNEKVGPGKFVAFTYRLLNAENGELLFEAKKEAPDTMVYGLTQEIIPGLQNVMKDLKIQDKFSVTLPPEVAFGHRVDENVITLPLSTFARDGKVAEEVKVGAMLPMLTEDGYTVTGNQCPDPEFGYNRPGPKLIVGDNAPDVKLNLNLPKK